MMNMNVSLRKSFVEFAMSFLEVRAAWELRTMPRSVTAALSPLLSDASILAGIILYLINYAFGILELRKAN